jgi:CRP-like cAMP-binding protein
MIAVYTQFSKLYTIYSQMFEQLRNKFPLSDDKWHEYINCFKRIDVPSKTILLKEGEISNKVFLIEKGCIRAWFNNDGKDVTFQFFFENNTVASVESFRKKILSPVTIETIEQTVLWYIHKKDIDRIIAEITEEPVLRNKFIDAIFERTFDYMKHFFSFIKDTSAQRYINLIKDKPHVVNRIPQHYIASYLGISTVHLSRIKNKLAKKKP